MSRQPQPGSARDLIPDAAGSARVIAVVGGLSLFAVVVGWIGFQISMFAFLGILIYTLGRRGIALTLVLSISVSFVITYMFRNMLDVQLPLSSLEFLANMGL